MLRIARAVLGALLGAAAGLAASPAAAELKVVASFSILADFVREIGGDRVAVTALVGPGGDAHVYQPKPTDAKALGGAGLVVVNGLGFEGWLDRLIKSSGYAGKVAVASQGIAPIAAADGQGHGKAPNAKGAGAKRADPHAWQDVGRALVYVRAIAAALGEADPANAAVYAANAQRYGAELEALDRWVRAEIGAIPAEKRKVITSHDAFGYFADAYGVAFLAPAGLSTEKEPSAKDVARLVRQARRERVRAIFVETMTDPRLVGQLAREVGASVGGALYADALSPPGGPADTYIKMVRHNVTQLRDGMARN